MNTVAEAPAGQSVEAVLTEGRTHHAWRSRAVDEGILRQIYALMKWGATAANACPMRIVFVRSPAGKARLIPCLHPENVVQTIEAPVTAIIGYDMRFYGLIPRLMPSKPEFAELFAGEERRALVRETALRNSSLQGAYLMLAARSLGLDCGPMSGFDGARLNAEFFPDGRIEVNFLCNLGYGDRSHLAPRAPRLGFEEVCRFV